MTTVYAIWQGDAFRASEPLDALAALGEQSPLARAEIESLLLRLTHDDSRCLVVRAATVVTRLQCLDIGTDARALLER